MLPRRFYIPNISIREVIKEARKNNVRITLHFTRKNKMILASRIELVSEKPVMLTHRTILSRRKYGKKSRNKRRS